jgi:hypothetical protein
LPPFSCPHFSASLFPSVPRARQEADGRHYEFDLTADDAIEVTLDKQANVRLLDDTNFLLYNSGKRHRYYGALAKASPFVLTAPRAGHWHVVIDLGGYAGTVRASARVLQGA